LLNLKYPVTEKDNLMGKQVRRSTSQRIGPAEGRLKQNRTQEVDEDASPRKINTKRLKTVAVTPRGNQRLVLEQIDKQDLVFLIGAAGSGKTFLPVVYAVDQLIQGNITKIVAVRPAVEAGDSIGYLTGGLADKMGPYLRPVLDAFEKILGKPQLDMLMKAGIIEITSLTYLRGRTISDAVYIMDEMQNATPSQLKMALTRIGEGCTAVVTMDPSQCDIPYEDSSCHEVSRFENHPDISVVRFSTQDVVRSEIVKSILKIYGT
jgi:phosphate starvation-inducible PhoH-like protein